MASPPPTPPPAPLSGHDSVAFLHWARARRRNTSGPSLLSVMLKQAELLFWDMTSHRLLSTRYWWPGRFITADPRVSLASVTVHSRRTLFLPAGWIRLSSPHSSRLMATGWYKRSIRPWNKAPRRIASPNKMGAYISGPCNPVRNINWIRYWHGNNDGTCPCHALPRVVLGIR